MLDTAEFWQIINQTTPIVDMYNPNHPGLKMTPNTYIVNGFLYKRVYDLEKEEIF